MYNTSKYSLPALEQIFTISAVLGCFAVHYVVSSGFILTKSLYIYIYAFSRRIYPKRFTQAIHFFVCVPWELNPQPLF